MTDTISQAFTKPSCGNFFEDFSIDQVLLHGVPRTITESDATLYIALTGSRYALYCAETIARKCGFINTPLDNFLVFHIAFGKTVNDISLNAVANLGYADVQFHQASFAGDTLSVTSKVIGLKENSNGKTGIVYVHSKATNQNSQLVVEWKRWVMVKKNDIQAKTNEEIIPSLVDQADIKNQNLPDQINFSHWQSSHSDYQKRYSDLKTGETLFHQDGMTINDSDHSLATRLYQNNARVHFNQHMVNSSANGKRLVYGGHIISICRALSYNGLGNAMWLSAINGGSHCNPSFAGDTIYCQSKILDKFDIKGRNDLGVVRIQMLGIKNNTPDKIEALYKESEGKKKYHSDVVLDLDYCALMLK
ncbi:MAG: MaoC family dehydratase [Kangiellaceae bacterium]